MIDNISGQLIYNILLLKRKKYGGNKVLALCVLCCQAITVSHITVFLYYSSVIPYHRDICALDSSIL